MKSFAASQAGLTIELQPDTVAVLGVPLDRNSSFRRGAAAAPGRIIDALHSDSTNLCTENGLDLSQSNRWGEVGRLDLTDGPSAMDEIERVIGQLIERGIHVIALGGDHSITYPIVRAYKRKFSRLNILQFDAHPDLYEDLDGNPYSHASPFSRIMESGLAERLVQVGIRSMTLHQKEQASRFDVEVIEIRDWQNAPDVVFEGPVYLSVDLDCLDPAFAPGVSHYEPGGMTTRQVLQIIQDLKGKIVGADIVELNPDRDWMDMTAMVAAKLLKEILSRMLGDIGNANL